MDRRASRAVEPPLDLGDLQLGIERRIDDDGLAFMPQCIDTGGEGAESHGVSVSGGS